MLMMLVLQVIVIEDEDEENVIGATEVDDDDFDCVRHEFGIKMTDESLSTLLPTNLLDDVVS